jgi:hypothetical protein
VGTTFPYTWVFAPLIAFGLYRRLRLTFGRQLLAPRSMKLRIGLLCTVGVFLLTSLPTVAGFAAAAAGALAGSTLAALALRHTAFENSDAGVYYTPNRWIGLAVMALFLGRLAARLVVVYRITEEALATGMPPEGLHRSALTVAFYFLLAAYYVGYYLAVLRRARELAALSPPGALPRTGEGTSG